MAGWPGPNNNLATSQASAISVAVGIPRPQAHSTWPIMAFSPINTAIGPSTPPIVPSNGLIALAGGFSAPPGKQDSVISLAAMPKKKTIKYR